MADIESAWVAAAASIFGAVLTACMTFYSGRRNEHQQKLMQGLQDSSVRQMESLKNDYLLAMERFKNTNARALELLKSDLGEEHDTIKSRRDYEYEARKKLYTELYPLSFQLNEAAAYARKRIVNIALATRTGALDVGPDNWITGPDSYYFNNIIYAVLAPLAIVEIMTRKLTQLDLSLDHNLRLQYLSGRAAFEALRSDFNLVDKPYPQIEFGLGHTRYQPPEVAPSAMPSTEERWRWRQGLYSGQISQALNSLIISVNEVQRLMTYAEFAGALGGVDLRDNNAPAGIAGDLKRAVAPLIALFRNFHPARRPITWRILLCQAVCYRAVEIATRRKDVAQNDVVRESQLTDAEVHRKFEWLESSAELSPELKAMRVNFVSEMNTAFEAANLYIQTATQEFATTSP
jgi:hypothetical protein